MASLLDREGERFHAMWVQAGIQFRSNVVERVGAEIPLHAHSFDHVAICTSGWFDCRIQTPDDKIEEFQIAAKDYRTNADGFNPVSYRVLIEGWHIHRFILRGGPGEILCIFPESM